MRKPLKGFTLIETTVVLVLLGTMLLIGAYRSPSLSQQRGHEKLFWEQFQTLWQEQVFLASAYSHRQQVEIHGNFIRFNRWIPGEPTTLSQTDVKMPATLFHAGVVQFININKNGHANLLTVYLQSSLRPNVRIKLTSIMGWGAYRIAYVT
ncbi:hypothetical protein C5Z26_03945 [Lactobacillus sp. CBA3606]|uniref:type II secretion system protein n=1 Tax=Lactobacillus sp. CBA3606 TaxID=2099789 RepID=UPI000CFC00BD|nr:type II secretion system protein [Lactobacillus sp. CBA3606]AVK63303.1 hypothetical protein C5Z26_03945 [Lactobacillus sp. CBA3606]